MKRIAIVIASLLAVTSALAESTAGSSSGSTAVVAPVNVGNPVINLPASPGHVKNEIDSNQASSAATVFVNPPAADTCAKAGSGASLQLAGIGGAVSSGGDPSETCETRADSINLKVIGAAPAVIKARHCQSPAMAQAYEDAGDPCPARLRPAQARQEQARAEAVLNGQAVATTTDPYIAARLARK